METEINIAKFWTRVWALAIDSILLAVFGYLIGLAFQDFLVSMGDYGLLFGLCIVVVYQTILNSKIGGGQTIGKRAMDIHVVDIDGATIDTGKAFLRAFILCFPYFIVDMAIPGFSETSIINIVKTIILTAVLTGVVVIYIFNKQTRQSLHDLLVGTYVATTKRNEVPTILPAVTKTPFYVFGGLVALLIGLSVFVIRWKTTEFNGISNFYDKVTDLDGVLKTRAGSKTTFSKGAKTLSFEIKLSVQNLPTDKLENDKVVRDVVRETLDNVTGIDNYDLIKVSMSKGYNIGIASIESTKTISQSPGEWREVLK